MLSLPLAALACSQYPSTQNGSPLTAFSSSPLSTTFSPSQQPLPFSLGQPCYQPFSLNEVKSSNTIATPSSGSSSSSSSQQSSPSIGAITNSLDQNYLLSQINSLLQQKDKSPEEQMQQSVLISTVLSQIQQQQLQRNQFPLPISPALTFLQQQPTEETTRTINLSLFTPFTNTATPQHSYSQLPINSIDFQQFHPQHQLQQQVHQSQPLTSLTGLPISLPLIKSISDHQSSAQFTFPSLSLLQDNSNFQHHISFINQAAVASNIPSSLTDLNMKRAFSSLATNNSIDFIDTSNKKLKLNNQNNTSIESVSFQVIQQSPATTTTTTTGAANKRKDEKDTRNRSRFHNLTKLFLNSLLSIFTRENMNQLAIAEKIQEGVIACIAQVKQSGRKTQGKVCKTDLFNHSHYKALFLKLTPESIHELSTKPKDIQLHRLCFNVDLLDHSLDQDIIDYINELKKAIFETTQFVLGNPVDSDSVKDEYWLRAIVGIKQLAEGKLIYRFQSIQASASSSSQTTKSTSSIADSVKQEQNLYAEPQLKTESVIPKAEQSDENESFESL